VSTEAAPVQTESAERAGLIGSRQMMELPLKGRSYMGTAGFCRRDRHGRRESPGWNDLTA